MGISIYPDDEICISFLKKSLLSAPVALKLTDSVGPARGKAEESGASNPGGGEHAQRYSYVLVQYAVQTDIPGHEPGHNILFFFVSIYLTPFDPLITPCP